MLFQGDGVEADAAYALRFLRAAAEKAMGSTPRRVGSVSCEGVVVSLGDPTSCDFFLNGFMVDRCNLTDYNGCWMDVEWDL